MRQIVTFLGLIIACSTAFRTSAQSFTRFKDTVWLTYYKGTGGGMQEIYDKITVPTGGPAVGLHWYISYCNFPQNWLDSAGPGICDNNKCYSFSGPAMSGLYPGGYDPTSMLYPAGFTGDFHMQIGLSAVDTFGTYYTTVRITDTSAAATTTTSTFAISVRPPSEVPEVNSLKDITLYPNPANNELNLVYDTNADIKTVSVYDIIGKVMLVYKVSGNSANLNLGQIPAGIYFVRLINANGAVVITKRFTKQ